MNWLDWVLGCNSLFGLQELEQIAFLELFGLQELVGLGFGLQEWLGCMNWLDWVLGCKSKLHFLIWLGCRIVGVVIVVIELIEMIVDDDDEEHCKIGSRWQPSLGGSTSGDQVTTYHLAPKPG